MKCPMVMWDVQKTHTDMKGNNMKLSSFLKLVEIQTKTASLMPFLLGIAYTYYRYEAIRPINLAIFFVSLICIDMATTAINNFMDYKRAKKREGYNYEIHNAIVRDQLSTPKVLTVIAFLLTVTIVAGIFLVMRTDLIILLVGMVAFGIGVLYSFGPLPISSTPFSELVSGIMMGGFIFFVTIYCQIYDRGIIYFALNDWQLILNLNLPELFAILFTCVPLILLIANIMLTNNICDMKDDYENHRYTLPFFIGKPNSLILFSAIHYLAYAFILISIILGFLPVITALTFFTIIPVRLGIKTFMKEQYKESTFIISVKHFMLISGVYLMSLLFHIATTLLMD